MAISPASTSSSSPSPSSSPLHEQHQHHPISIAIIGAGYAGLSLANLLERMNQDLKKADSNVTSPTDLFRIVLLDALHPPSPLTGDLCVPNPKHLYKALGWNWTFDNDAVIPEEALLQDLRRTADIEYQRYCYKIEPQQQQLQQQDSNMKLSLLVWNRKTDECFRHPSTFDFVIICNGVRSSKLVGQVLQTMPTYFLPSVLVNKTNQQRSTMMEDRILLLGDARWTPWWDFGRHRITQGANQALDDAMQVSQLLLQELLVRRRRRQPNCEQEVLQPVGLFHDWGKFGLRNKRQEILRHRIFLTIILLFMLLPVATLRLWCDI
ncbi:hypothetical protein MHU86_1712 [Fragilaria crotonensis]|nr:hypothetical protein MHU86_1712 [Fragilaria crotonensis]